MALSLPGHRRRAFAPGPALRLAAGLTVLTVAVGTIGATVGASLAARIESAVVKRLENQPPSVEVKETYRGGATLRRLSPIVTNLAAPRDKWVRLEAALVIAADAKDNPDVLAGAITEDLLTYLRSLTAPQLEGASGLRNLREDLAERIAIRSKGVVRELVIETLVVQ